METQLIELLLIRVREQKSSIELFLANGGAKTFDEYSRLVGEYSAFCRLESDIKDAEQTFIES
jgi:hypothetical protein